MDGPVLRERGERGFEAETAIKSAHRRRGEELVLLGANFDNPLAVRSFNPGDEDHFSVSCPTVACLNRASDALRPTQIIPQRRMSAEGEGGHNLLGREAEFDRDIGRVGYDCRVHWPELARSTQPPVMELLRGWSDARERFAVPSQALVAFGLDRNQKPLS
jgi:hypothetical protein